MNYFIESVKDIYETVRNSFNPQYCFAGIDNELLTDLNRKNFDLNNSCLESRSYHKKGDHHLHSSPHIIEFHINGKPYKVDKREKPEGESLLEWIAASFRLSKSNKAIKKAIKSCQ